MLIKTVTTKSGNVGEIIYKTARFAEFRLFNHDKSQRLFQCLLDANKQHVKITLAASFTETKLKTMHEVGEILMIENFKSIEFERKLGGKKKVRFLKN